MSDAPSEEVPIAAESDSTEDWARRERRAFRRSLIADTEVTELNSGTRLAARMSEFSLPDCYLETHIEKDPDEETALPAIADDKG